MLLLLDNYDSFTYNLAQYLGQLGQDVEVIRNDAIDLEGIEELAPEHIVLSPGPCTPNEAGISMDVVTHFAGKVGILGVCLGHQSIAQAFGGRIVRAKRVMHGKLSKAFHNEEGIFTGLANPLRVTRYHSLLVDKDSLPDALEVTAKTWQDEVMAIEHREFRDTTTPIVGVQFHPESIETQDGRGILSNFLHMSGKR